MAITIRLTPDEWKKIKEQIVADYGKAMIMISWKTKRELGFTVREHTEYIRENLSDDWFNMKKSVHLDFYDDHQETMFRLKYL